MEVRQNRAPGKGASVKKTNHDEIAKRKGLIAFVIILLVIFLSSLVIREYYKDSSSNPDSNSKNQEKASQVYKPKYRTKQVEYKIPSNGYVEVKLEVGQGVLIDYYFYDKTIDSNGVIVTPGECTKKPSSLRKLSYEDKLALSCYSAGRNPRKIKFKSLTGKQGDLTIEYTYTQ